MQPVVLTSRRRALAVVVLATALGAIALPARADSAPSVSAAKQNLAQAQQHALQASTALGAAQQQLAGAQLQLATVQARVVSLNQTVTTDTARVVALDQQVGTDKAELAGYVRSVYKSGGESGALAYIVAASTLGDVFQRVAEMDRVNQAGRILLTRIADAQTAARQALADATAAQAQAVVAGRDELREPNGCDLAEGELAGPVRVGGIMLIEQTGELHALQLG